MDCCLVFFLLLLVHGSSATRFLGVNYGRLGDNLRPPADVAKLLASHGITKVKLYDSDAEVISALVSSPTNRLEIAITLYNEAIWELSSSPATAASWVERNRASLPPAVSTIYVGNEVLTRGNPSLRPLLVSALTNLRSALNTTITTAHALDVLDMATSFPPSNARFAEQLQPYLGPLLDFLARTGSPFVVDAYPYFAYRDDHGKGSIELGYALLDAAKSKGVTDLNTKLHYTNMLDAMVDAVYAAMAKMGHHGDVRVVVGETGWPSAGNSTTGAGRENAAAFVGNLVKRLATGRGTPMQPNVSLEAYVFALFNEDLKQGSAAERNFGLFYPNMTQVYNVSLTIAN